MKLVTIAMAALVTALSPTAWATWSVAVLNPATGTIAVAGASCSFMVYGITSVLPGKGVVIVQAASNAKARADATAWLEAGESLDGIMAKLIDPASGYEPAEQQYALLGVGADARPRTYTGTRVEGAKGAVAADHVTVQANTMVSDNVVKRTSAALGKANWADDEAMARAVMRAMDAGAAAGGDKRCGAANSASAFVGLYRKDDSKQQPWMELVVYGIEPGTASAMTRLDRVFDTSIDAAMRSRSTRLFIVPATIAPDGPH
ncbi:MAG: DUF1028 domain-containing protein [Rhodanobacteraceae bacterium]